MTTNTELHDSQDDSAKKRALVDAIQAGIDSGPGVNANAFFESLKQKYRLAHNQSTTPALVQCEWSDGRLLNTMSSSGI